MKNKITIKWDETNYVTVKSKGGALGCATWTGVDGSVAKDIVEKCLSELPDFSGRGSDKEDADILANAIKNVVGSSSDAVSLTWIIDHLTSALIATGYKSVGETFTEARKNKDMFYRDKDAWLK